jgi:hypothetical protein
MSPDEKAPGYVLCAHCGEYEGKVACPDCRYLVCGPCALEGCARTRPGPRTGAFRSDGRVTVDHARGRFRCGEAEAAIGEVIEVIVETRRLRGAELQNEWRVRLVMGDRATDLIALVVRALDALGELDRLVAAQGEALARALGVPLRYEKGF